MKIRTKLLACFLFIVLIMILLQYLSFIKLREISKPLNQDIPASIENLQQISKLNSLAQVLRFYNELLMQSARNYVLTQDKKWKTRFYEFKPEMESVLNKALNYSQGQNKKTFRSIKEAGLFLNNKHHSAIQMINHGMNPVEVIETLEGDDYQAEYNKFWDGLKVYFSEQGADYKGAVEGIQVERSMVTVKLAAARAQELIIESLNLGAIFFCVMISISTVLTLILTTSISRPIQFLIKYVKHIKEGDISQRVPIDSSDEVGELATAFNQMTADLEKTMVSRDKLVEEIERRKTIQKSLEHQTKELNEQRSAALNLMDDAEEAQAKAERAERETEQQKSDLEKVNLELDSFVYTASHDLRAPLRSISSFAGFLEQDYNKKLDKEGKRYVVKIRNAANSLSELIDDLLALSRISRIKNPYEKIQINKLIDSIKKRIEFDLKEYKVNLKIQDNMPSIICDRVKMGEVFLNLINNAVKFSSKNKKVNPKVEIGYNQTSDTHEFYVKDNGIGIDPKYHEKIFKIFSRLHKQSEYDGTGAGLSIVQRVIKDHGGKIWVDSKEGKGATFYFTIPKNLKPKD